MALPRTRLSLCSGMLLRVGLLGSLLAVCLPAQVPKAGSKAGPKSARAVRPGLRPPGMGARLGAPGILQIGAERERNDAAAWADAFGANTEMDGTLWGPFDQDVYLLEVVGDAYATLTLSPRGTAPATIPALLVTDAAGQFVGFAAGTASRPYPGLTLPLPAGSFFLNVYRGRGAAGDYRLGAVQAPAAFRPIPFGVPLNGALAAAREDAYRLIVPTDGRVTITTAGGSLDLYLSILLPNGALYRYVDDGSTGLDPGFDAPLPAGLYLLVIGELSGAAGPYSFSAAFAPGAIPAAPCGSARVTGVITGDESYPLYRLSLASPQQVSFVAGPDGTNPLQDSVLYLLDANLNGIGLNDDDGFSLYSRIGTVLPAGTYYVALASFPYSTFSPEGYSLTGTCAGPVSAPFADFGRNAGSLTVQGDAAAFRVQIGTPQPVEFLVDTSGGTLSDPMLAVLDGSGLLVAANDDMPFGSDSFAGRELGPGTYWVLVRDYDNLLGSFDLRVDPVLGFTDRVSDRILNVTEKAGRQIFAFAALRPLPAPIPLPPPLGALLIDLGQHVFLGAYLVPPTGSMIWPINFQPYPVVIQGVSLEPATNLLWMTEMVR